MIVLAFLIVAVPFAALAGSGSVRKQGDVVVYSDDSFYSSFPSVVKTAKGDLLVAFRRAPERRQFGEASSSHTDANSYLVMVRSADGGRTWTKEPALIYAHAFGGSQDPCMLQLRSGDILCSSYGWAPIESGALSRLTGVTRIGNFAFLGGYLVRSKDAGQTWTGPIYPPPRSGEKRLTPFGAPLPAYNRGAMCESRDGRLFWAVASQSATTPARTGTHLMISTDQGQTWRYSCVIADDEKATFNETSLYETPRGDLVAFMRTAGLEDHGAVARSKDGGKTFAPWQDMGFQGHPHHALRLADKRVLLVYGYRHPPYGVRARVLDAECQNYSSAPELVLRDDGGNSDLGYPWAVQVSKRQALVVYYFNTKDGTRHIAGTFLDLD